MYGPVLASLVLHINVKQKSLAVAVIAMSAVFAFVVVVHSGTTAETSKITNYSKKSTEITEQKSQTLCDKITKQEATKITRRRRCDRTRHYWATLCATAACMGLHFPVPPSFCKFWLRNRCCKCTSFDVSICRNLRMQVPFWSGTVAQRLDDYKSGNEVGHWLHLFYCLSFGQPNDVSGAFTFDIMSCSPTSDKCD